MEARAEIYLSHFFVSISALATSVCATTPSTSIAPEVLRKPKKLQETSRNIPNTQKTTTQRNYIKQKRLLAQRIKLAKIKYNLANYSMPKNKNFAPDSNAKSLGLLVFVTSRSIWTSGFSLKYLSISGLLRSFFPQGAIT